MKERLNNLLSEVGESFDYLRSDVRNLGRYLAELEDLIESYRAFAITLTPPTPDERAALRKLLKRTLKVVGPAPEESSTLAASAIPDRASAPDLKETPSMIQ
jgi:hypothetical protein